MTTKEIENLANNLAEEYERFKFENIFYKSCFF